MTRVECRRCGESFNTDREGVTPGQDTTRCPECGASHDVPESDGDGADADETLQVAADGVTVRITIEIEPTA